MNSKYINVEILKSDLKKNYPEEKYNAIELCSNDTINEEKLWKTIVENKFKDELLSATIQMAIIGYGNKQFNQYKYKGETKNLNDLFRRCSIKNDNHLGSVLKEEDLTPRRLIRMFRVHIHHYLEVNPETASYLYYKYSDLNEKFKNICFPGAEFLVESIAEGDFLMECYIRLDSELERRNLQHGISQRVRRILLARGKISQKV